MRVWLACVRELPYSSAARVTGGSPIAIPKLRLRCECCSRGGSIGAACSASVRRACRAVARGARAPRADGGAERSAFSDRGVAIATPSSFPTAIRADACFAGAIPARRRRRGARRGRRRRGALLEPKAAAAQALQFGYNCDGIGLFPLDVRASSSVRRITSSRCPALMFPGWVEARAARALGTFVRGASARVAYMQAAVGLSVVELERGRESTWGYRASVRATTAGSPRIRQSKSPGPRAASAPESARRGRAARVRHARQLRGRQDAVAHLSSRRRKMSTTISATAPPRRLDAAHARSRIGASVFVSATAPIAGSMRTRVSTLP